MSCISISTLCISSSKVSYKQCIKLFKMLIYIRLHLAPHLCLYTFVDTVYMYICTYVCLSWLYWHFALLADILLTSLTNRRLRCLHWILCKLWNKSNRSTAQDYKFFTTVATLYEWQSTLNIVININIISFY